MSKFTRLLAPALVLSLGLGAALPASAATPAPSAAQTHQATPGKTGPKAAQKRAGEHRADAGKHHDCKNGKHMARNDTRRAPGKAHDAKSHPAQQRDGDRNQRDARRG